MCLTSINGGLCYIVHSHVQDLQAQLLQGMSSGLTEVLKGIIDVLLSDE